MGLSATPLTLWDQERNDMVLEYFGGIIYRWTIHDAIHPPKGFDPCLSPYYYHVEFCTLGADEMERYNELSAEISKITARLNPDKEGFNKRLDSNPALQRLLFERSDVVQECESRFDLLRKVVAKYDSVLRKCIVYCNTLEEIDRVQKILSSMGYDSVKYHSQLKGKSRESALEDFRHGSSRFIIAKGCLDQGVDIPNCDSAIIMSSSREPREYIQRRGRVLRLSDRSKIATIIDFFVLPYDYDSIATGSVSLDRTESDVIRKQLDRIGIFIDDSFNAVDNDILIQRIRAKCGVEYHGPVDQGQDNS